MRGGRPFRPVAAVLALAAGLARASPPEAPAAPELADLIECRASYADMLALLPVAEDPLQAVARGWQPLPQANPFMVEFRLLAPITVFGHSTDHIALAGPGVLAVLDLPDPRPLARQLELEAGIDTPEKAMFGREVRAVEVPGPDGTPWIESAVLGVSNVDSHPGKTLAGCSYGLEPAEPGEDGEDGDPAGTPPTQASALPSPAPALPR